MEIISTNFEKKHKVCDAENHQRWGNFCEEIEGLDSLSGLDSESFCDCLEVPNKNDSR